MKQDGFPQKYSKKITPEFTDGINAMQEEEIKQRILTCEQHLYDVDDAMDKDEELMKAKEHAKECAARYKETKGVETAKIKYCLYILETRGVSLSKD